MFRYNRRSSRWNDDGAEIWAALVLWALALLLVVGWLVVRGVGLVCQALRQHRDHQGLWRMFWLWAASVAVLGLVGLCAATGLLTASVATSAAVIAGTAVGISTLLLLIVARLVSVAHQQLFSPPKEQLATRVLHRPWWPPMDAAA